MRWIIEFDLVENARFTKLLKRVSKEKGLDYPDVVKDFLKEWVVLLGVCPELASLILKATLVLDPIETLEILFDALSGPLGLDGTEFYPPNGNGRPSK